jgi:hypothetical protein
MGTLGSSACPLGSFSLTGGPSSIQSPCVHVSRSASAVCRHDSVASFSRTKHARARARCVCDHSLVVQPTLERSLTPTAAALAGGGAFSRVACCSCRNAASEMLVRYRAYMTRALALYNAWCAPFRATYTYLAVVEEGQLTLLLLRAHSA